MLQMSIVVGGLTYYFTEMLQIQPFNVTLYDDMINSPEFQEEKRYTLSVEVMSGSYFDGKTVNEIQLPERCEIINIHRDRKDIPPAKQKLVPGQRNKGNYGNKREHRQDHRGDAQQMAQHDTHKILKNYTSLW